MSNSESKDVVIDLIKKTIAEYGGSISVFPRNPKDLNTRLIQPIHDEKGPDKDFVDKCVVSLQKVAASMGLADKLNIVSFSEKGPDYDSAGLCSNEVHKVKIITLQ